MRSYDAAPRKAGEISKKIEKAQNAGPGRGHKNESGNHGDVLPKAKVLEEAGISTQQASEWERLSDEGVIEGISSKRLIPTMRNSLGKMVTPDDAERPTTLGQEPTSPLKPERLQRAREREAGMMAKGGQPFQQSTGVLNTPVDLPITLDKAGIEWTGSEMDPKLILLWNQLG